MASTVARVVLEMGSTVADIEKFMEELGGEIPVIGTALKTLGAIREKVENVQSNAEGLKALEVRCTYVTARVVVKCRENPSSEISVAPLESYINAAEELLERCSRRGWCGRCTKASSDKDEIAALNARVDSLTGDLSLSGIVTLERVMTAILAQNQAPAAVRVAAVPKGKPAEQSWHVARDRVVDAVYDYLSAGGQTPRVVGLVGRSGSGKTTCAASIVGEPKGGDGYRQNETGDRVLRRLNRVREHFCDGVVWLRVGRGAGAAERVPALMSHLAKTVYEELADSYGYAPGASPTEPRDGSVFVRDFVLGTTGGGAVAAAAATSRQKRCLIVADDVWEVDILEELRQTGMWVLFTTRDPRLVERVEGSAVPVDQLSKAEAESLLRGAAELPTGSSLPSAAAKIIERCDRMANRLEFVGRWSTVKGSDDEEDWAEAVAAIDAEMGAMMTGEGAEEGQQEERADDHEEGLSGVRRVAILRAGFLDLAAQKNRFNPLLYLSLAVMPDGRAFGPREAAVLLYDDGAGDGKGGTNNTSQRRARQAAGVVANLEQWAVVTTMHGNNNKNLFRMHDAHTNFAREKLKKSEDVRAPAVRRWQSFISTLDTVRSTDYFELVDLWHATEVVGGESWRLWRPYHAALDSLQDSSPECIPSLKAVVEFGINECAWGVTHGVALRLLRVQRKDAAVEDAEVRHTLESLIHCANALDLTSDGDAHRRELLLMVDAAWENRSKTAIGSPPRRVAGRLLERGQQLAIVRRPNEAYESICEALRIQEEDGSSGNFERLEVSETLEFQAIVLVDLKRYGEGVTVYQRCLRIKEDLYGQEHLRLTVTLHNLAVCVLKRGEPGDVETASELFRRALRIKEAKTGGDHVGLVRTLNWLRRCAEQAGKPDEENHWEERIKRLEDANAATTNNPTAV